MIIPDNLSPLPVMPAASETDPAKKVVEDGFVSEKAVRQLLVGPMMVTPLVTTRVPESHGFAGRDDLDREVALPFVALSSDEAFQDEPVKELIPNGPHPALAEPKHAAPPRPRIQGISRSNYRRSSDRWWVLGMGIALLAVIASGALIELVSNEALRRAQASPDAAKADGPAVVLPRTDRDGADPSLAASNPEYPAP